MLILSRVCAEFRNRLGQTVFTITPAKLLSFLEAPEEIQEDPLFSMMLADGSLEAVRSVEQRCTLENDPTAGIAPDGSRLRPTADPAVEAADPDSAPEKPAAEPKPEGRKAGKSTKKAEAASAPAETSAAETSPESGADASKTN